MRHIQKVALVGVALMAIQPPAYAVQMPGVKVVADGATRAQGNANSYWYASRPHINITWQDLSDDGHPVHADAYFWAFTQQKKPNTNFEFYNWVIYDKKTTVNINKKPNPSTAGYASGLYANTTNYNSSYQVCVQYDWSPDACKGVGRYGY